MANRDLIRFFRSQFVVLSNKHPNHTLALRYLVASAFSAGACAVLFFLKWNHVRDPYGLLFLAAFAVSLWVTGNGPALAGFAVSTVSLILFLHSPNGWPYILWYDAPLYCVYLLLAFGIYYCAQLLRRERLRAKQAQERLEAEVQARTAELEARSAELVRVNAEYAILLNSIDARIAMLDLSRVVLRCNDAYERMLGFAPGEIIGQIAPIPAREWKTWHKQMESLRSGQTLRDYETIRIRRDGTEFPATISQTPLRDELGNVIRMVGVIVDNTERYAREAERRMLFEMVQHSPNFMGVADLTGRARVVNRAGQKMFGLENDEDVRGTHILDYFAESEREHARDKLIPELIEHGHLEFETAGRNLRTGVEFALQCTCFVMPDPRTGKAALLAAVAQDISERRKAEKRLQMFCSVVQKSPDSIVITTSELIPVFVNRAGHEYFGISKEDQQPQWHILDLFPEEERDRVRGELATILRTQAHLTREIPMRNLVTGEVLNSELTAFVILDSLTGTLLFLAAVIKDIAERKRAEEELRRQQARVEALEREQLSRENISLREQVQIWREGTPAAEWSKEIIGSSLAIRQTTELVERVASSESTVLITGETGTGKELIARAIHLASARAEKPFKPLNLAEIPRDLVETTLFGNEKGAFTSANERRHGLFDQAQGGTIFLDEIGELAVEQQGALLRVLQEREFYRVGGAGIPIATDARVVAATNRDLHAAMQEGRFRRDLYYRLNVVRIDVPPLRDRKEDIEPLVMYFVALFSRKVGRDISEIDQRSMEKLQAYSWPGNIRELQNIVERAVVQGTGKILMVEERWLAPIVPLAAEDPGPAATMPLRRSRLEHERQRIEDALRRSRGQVGGAHGAAEILRMPISTLHSRMRVLGIKAHQFKSES